MESLETTLDTYLAHCRYEKNLSVCTLKAYRLDLQQFLRVNQLHGIDRLVDKAHIQGYIEWLHTNKLMTASIRRKLIAVKAFLSYLDLERGLTENPFRNLKISMRITRKLPAIMSLEEIRSILDAAKNDLEQAVGLEFHKIVRQSTLDEKHIPKVQALAIFELLFSTGMRVGELCSLLLSDIDLARNTITVNGKGMKQRVLSISHRDVLMLLALHKRIRAIYHVGVEQALINRLRRPISSQSVRRLVHKYAVKVKIQKKITPHTFRHTTATLLVENGTDIRIVQSLLGHSSILTTQLYTQISAQALKRMMMINHPRNQL